MGNRQWSDYALKVYERRARRYPNGSLIQCKPTQAELNTGKVNSDHKVIFNTEADAQATALEMFNLIGVRLYSYECPRSRTGHRHLTTSKRNHTEDRKLRGGL